ncbi:helix-turn-helix transcriptional regulator [Marinobacterium sediminicola]|nr:helix-turn-helix transcriptional regulator [Marinobacterium sediminicola]
MTLSKIINHRGHSTVTDNLDRLCAYFDCPIEKLVTYVKMPEGEREARSK